MANVTRIIRLFGGQVPMAAALGVTQSTISRWNTNNLIPARHQIHVLETARARGIDLKPDDFFASAEEGAAA